MNKLQPSIAPAIIWLLYSSVLLTIPGSAFPKENWFDRLWMDKWVHVFMFFLLVWLWCWALQKSPSRQKIFTRVTIGAISYGILMECVQHYLVQNRSFDYGDMIADAAGALIGLAYSWGRYIKK